MIDWSFFISENPSEELIYFTDCWEYFCSKLSNPTIYDTLTSPIFQVQKWNAKAIPFKKKPFKSQQLQPLQQIELHNVQSQKNVRLLFKEYHYKIQEVDHQSKPPPLRKSVRNHEVENFSDWWFWIILDGLLTASVCCHFIFR